MTKLTIYKNPETNNKLTHYSSFGDLYNPFSVADGWHSTVDRLFNSKFFDFDTNLQSSQAKTWSSNENSYSLEIEIPGVKKDSIGLEIKDNHLYLSYKDKTQEYSYSCPLPKGDIDKLTAKYEDGVLYLKIPKLESQKPKKITIL